MSFLESLCPAPFPPVPRPPQRFYSHILVVWKLNFEFHDFFVSPNVIFISVIRVVVYSCGENTGEVRTFSTLDKQLHHLGFPPFLWGKRSLGRSIPGNPEKTAPRRQVGSQDA